MNNETIWNVPIPTREVIMKDKKMNYNILAKTMLESNRNPNPTGLKKDDDMRYIYKNKFNTEVKDYFITGEFGMKKQTFEKHWRYIKKVDFDIVGAENSKNGIIYKLNYKNSDGNEFVTVPSDILNELVECTNLNVIKIYLVLLYTCNKDNYTQVSQTWLCEKIGFSKGSRNRMSTILSFLKDKLKLIDINIVNGDTCVSNGKEIVKKNQYIKLL